MSGAHGPNVARAGGPVGAVAHYFRNEGRQLLANGYLIVPIKPGEKRPAISGWQNARIGVADLARYPKHGVGVLCGQGAAPLVGIDVDTHNADLAQAFTDWCVHKLGYTAQRVGNAPKVLLVYRAAEAGWPKLAGPWFEGDGREHRLEVLGDGQQFVAHHIHPDTGRPYAWVDIEGGITAIHALDLPVVTVEQVQQAVEMFSLLAETMGLERRAPAASPKAPAAPVERTPAAETDFFGRVNEAALQHLGSWVPVLFPVSREYQGGYRVAQVDLGRDLQEDLSIIPSGIVDFGVADMGDARAGKRTPIDLVLEWGPQFLSDPLEVCTPRDAAEWLCRQLDTPPEALGWGLRAKKELATERQVVANARDAALRAVAECTDELVLLDRRSDVGQRIVEALQNSVIAPQVQGAVQARHKELTGKTLALADLRRLFADAAAPTVKARRPLTEFGNAERMLDKYGRGLMFVPELGAWYAWTGIFWRRAQQVEVEHYAKLTVTALVEEVADHPEPAEFFKFAAISQQAKMVHNMVALASSDPRVVVPVAELDRHSHLMGVGNGVVDLRTGRLLPPDPELRITNNTGVDYRQDAAAPLFEQTVREVFNDNAEQAEFFQRLIGYAATGNPVQQILVIPFGNGANGKSTVLGAVRKAFGTYAKAADASTFVSDGRAGANAGGAREDLLRLMGARFVYSSEPDENSELKEGQVKGMTGDEAITARGVYGKTSVEFRPTFTVFMPTNHKPIVKGGDDGIWRRLVMVPFTRNFEKDATAKRDLNRAERLASEVEGVLAWVVRGAMSYQQLGLKAPHVVEAARGEYRQQMDILADWLDECCEISPDHSVQSSALWASWEQFAKHRGILRYVPSAISLGRKLDSRFPSAKGSRGLRMRYGLRIRDDFEDVA